MSCPICQKTAKNWSDAPVKKEELVLTHLLRHVHKNWSSVDDSFARAVDESNIPHILDQYQELTNLISKKYGFPRQLEYEIFEEWGE